MHLKLTLWFTLRPAPTYDAHAGALIAWARGTLGPAVERSDAEIYYEVDGSAYASDDRLQEIASDLVLDKPDEAAPDAPEVPLSPALLALKLAEWGLPGVDQCPVCGRYKGPKGHQPDCEVALALGSTPNG